MQIQHRAFGVGCLRSDFFWLVDQPAGDDRQPSVQRSPAFAEWLTGFARTCGDFLDSPGSFRPQILRSFIDSAPNSASRSR